MPEDKFIQSEDLINHILSKKDDTTYLRKVLESFENNLYDCYQYHLEQMQKAEAKLNNKKVKRHRSFCEDIQEAIKEAME